MHDPQVWKCFKLILSSRWLQCCGTGSKGLAMLIITRDIGIHVTSRVALTSFCCIEYSIPCYGWPHFHFQHAAIWLHVHIALKHLLCVVVVEGLNAVCLFCWVSLGSSKARPCGG